LVRSESRLRSFPAIAEPVRNDLEHERRRREACNAAGQPDADATLVSGALHVTIIRRAAAPALVIGAAAATKVRARWSFA
jgi:hypothetical protein